MPDFASTGHMIQGATLDAVFCEMQDASGRAGHAQILAYVGASRVRLLSRIYILQPFSPLLFTQGPPKGPDVLLRKLQGAITPDQAQDEWLKPEKEQPNQDILKNKFLCVLCYIRGYKEFMYLPSAFGCRTPQDAISVLYTEGQWRRCLRCQDAQPKLTCTVCHVAKDTDAFNAKQRKNAARREDELRCTECETCKGCGVEQQDHRTFSRTHRHLCIWCEPTMCAICQQTLPRRSFTRQNQTRNCNLERNRKRCNECMHCKECGRVQNMNGFSTRPNYGHLCVECEPLQCARCPALQPRRNFPPRMLSNFKTRGGTLLCKSCTAAGYTYHNAKAYECRGCSQTYGHKHFNAGELNTYMGTDSVTRVRTKPLCTGCAQRAKELKTEVDKSQRRCKCNGAPNHQPLCPFGTSRKTTLWWPGGELKTVSRDDKQFLDRANMPWWQNLNIPGGI